LGAGSGVEADGNDMPSLNAAGGPVVKKSHLTEV